MRTLVLLSLLYQGSGTAVFPGRNTYQCPTVMLKLEITPKKFKVYEGGYDCSPLVATYDFFSLDIREGKLLDHNEVVGSISDKEITLEKYDPSDDSLFNLRMTFTEAGLDYTETWKQSGKEALVINASLLKETH